MWRSEFVSAATGRPLANSNSGDEVDSAEFRERLAVAFDTIHREIRCEHVPGEPFVVADAILRLDCPGVVIECGCFQGGFTAKLSHVCAAVGRRLFIFDSFEGLPNPTLFNGHYQFYPQRHDVHAQFGGASQQFRCGDYGASVESVNANVRDLGKSECCEFVRGWFADTLPTFQDAVALAFIDVDLIESARDCLRFLWPLLTGPRIFTHEAINQTYMEGILDKEWWRATLRCRPPGVIGAATGIQSSADCLAALLRPVESATDEVSPRLTCSTTTKPA